MADWNSGRDAAYIKPKFVPDEVLHGRDDSGGYDWSDNYTQQFGDGGRVTGTKSWLSAGGGDDGGIGDRETFKGGMVSDAPRKAAARRAAP